MQPQWHCQQAQKHHSPRRHTDTSCSMNADWLDRLVYPTHLPHLHIEALVGARGGLVAVPQRVKPCNKARAIWGCKEGARWERRGGHNPPEQLRQPQAFVCFSLRMHSCCPARCSPRRPPAHPSTRGEVHAQSHPGGAPKGLASEHRTWDRCSSSAHQHTTRLRRRRWGRDRAHAVPCLGPSAAAGLQAAARGSIARTLRVRCWAATCRTNAAVLTLREDKGRSGGPGGHNHATHLPPRPQGRPPTFNTRDRACAVRAQHHHMPWNPLPGSRPERVASVGEARHVGNRHPAPSSRTELEGCEEVTPWPHMCGAQLLGAAGTAQVAVPGVPCPSAIRAPPPSPGSSP